MEINRLLKRVAVDLAIIFGVVFLVGGTIAAYSQWEAKKKAAVFFAEEAAQANALSALSGVNLDPATMTFANLEQTLHSHQSAIKSHGRQDFTVLGWACGENRCAVHATFLVPFGEAIPSNTPPASMVLTPPLFISRWPSLAVGGVHLGEPADQVRAYCKNRGFGVETGTHRIAWDKDWTLSWAETKNGEIALMSFVNTSVLNGLNATGVKERSTK